MDIEVTPEAAEVLRDSLAAVGAAGVRLVVVRALGRGAEVQVEFAPAPGPGEQTIETAGVTLFVDPGVAEVVPDPLVALEPNHDTIVVRPRGAT